MINIGDKDEMTKTGKVGENSPHVAWLFSLRLKLSFSVTLCI